MPDDLSECEPPDPIPNSAVKPLSADDSVGFPHVKVGHRQAPHTKAPRGESRAGPLCVAPVMVIRGIHAPHPSGSASRLVGGGLVWCAGYRRAGSNLVLGQQSNRLCLLMAGSVVGDGTLLRDEDNLILGIFFGSAS